MNMFAVDKPRGGHKHLITRKKEIYVKRIKRNAYNKKEETG